MKKKILLFFFLMMTSLPVQLLSQIIPPEPTGRRLRIIVEDNFPADSFILGGTTGSWAFGTNTALIMDREFGYVTPENDFKQWRIHPDNSSVWNWDKSDAWISHIDENNQILRMHCPIGPQCSEWAQDDDRTASELETNMNDFLQTVCKRYNGTEGFEYMDVVNETIIAGNWHTDKPGYGWECPWFKIGQDTDANNTPLYIGKAFEIANEFAPDIKLIYNHNEHPEKEESWNLIKETVLYLRNKGLRVDGIGWQAHVDVGWETPEHLENLSNLIDWAHDNQLEFHITEASVWLENGNSQTELKRQAQTYGSIIETLLGKISTGKIGWNTWHIDDSDGWHPEFYPSLFDSVFSAKPAYYAIQDLLEDVSTGNEEIKENFPNDFKLYNNYPNPFSKGNGGSPSTTIKYSIPFETRNGNKLKPVTLKIYDVLGRKVATLVDEKQSAGNYKVVWNARNMPSGLYLAELVCEQFRKTVKMALVK